MCQDCGCSITEHSHEHHHHEHTDTHKMGNIHANPQLNDKKTIVVITKTDLLPYIDYDVEAEKKEARKLKPNVDILETNTKDDDSILIVQGKLFYAKRLDRKIGKMSLNDYDKLKKKLLKQG